MAAPAAAWPTRPGPRVPARLLRLASDERLVGYVRSGSEPAFEAVYDRYHRAILAFCRHMLGSVEEGEDAVQHTFMAAYRGLLGSRKPIQLRPWLYTIARNRCLSVLRARRETALDDVGELPTENLSVEVQRRQDLRDLLRDVAELPEDQRAALVLAEVGAASHEEIAQVLGVQRVKVKALVFQARSSLIASRAARETPCAEVRAELTELRGGALRRATLRRHLKACPGCRDFRAALLDQRKMLALVLPVVPTLALKQGVMAGALGSGAAAAGGAAAGGAAAGGAAAGGGSLLAGGGAAATAKVLAIAAVVGGGAVGVEAVTPHHPAATPARQGSVYESAAPAATQAPAGGTVAPATVTGEPQAIDEPATDQTPGASTRRGEERSAGHRGVERRTGRPAAPAAGPAPGHAQPGAGEREAAGGRKESSAGPDGAERDAASGRKESSAGADGAERDAASGRDESSAGADGAERERSADDDPPRGETPYSPKSGKPAKTSKPAKPPPEERGKPRPEKTPKPVAPAATVEPAASPTPTPAPTLEPQETPSDAGGGGKDKDEP